MKKQTAVELAKNNIEGEALAFIDGFLTFNEFMDNINKCFQQALEMEKQQIINTWYDCKLSIIDKNPTDADQYFNETFKK